MAGLKSATEIAEMTGINEWHLYSLARQGMIPCVRAGRRVLFNPEKVMIWMEEGGRKYGDPPIEPETIVEITEQIHRILDRYGELVQEMIADSIRDLRAEIFDILAEDESTT